MARIKDYRNHEIKDLQKEEIKNSSIFRSSMPLDKMCNPIYAYNIVKTKETG
jgi:hypothetical protein